MSLLRFLPRFLLVAIWIVVGLLSVGLIYPMASGRLRACMNRRWSRMLMCLCGIRVTVSGQPRLHGPVMLVANHVSWVDIFVLNGVRPTAFVAKSDIRGWPIIGWLVAGAGTVFIERGQRHAVRAASEALRQRFLAGEAVGLFPEGTTSPGYDVQPFHASLFEAAIQAGADIQPVALRFFHRGRRSDYFSFVGEQNLVQNLWCLLGTSGAGVEAVFLEPMDGERCRRDGRAKVAAHAHHAIRQAVVARSGAD